MAEFPDRIIRVPECGAHRPLTLNSRQVLVMVARSKIGPSSLIVELVHHLRDLVECLTHLWT